MTQLGGSLRSPKVEAALQTSLRLPIWRPMEMSWSENPAYDFTRRFTAGREPIVWAIRKHAVTTNDAAWMRECGRAVASLSRAELCVMHAYSTQTYSRITQFLRGLPVSELDLIHDASQEWMYGETRMLLDVRAGNRSGFLAPGVDPSALAALLVAWAAPPSVAKGRLCMRRYAALRPNFTSTFLRLCRVLSVRFNTGVAFVAQSGMTLRAFEHAIPLMTAGDWRRILNRFVASLDAIFAKMPPCHKGFYVYRGEASRRHTHGNTSFVSTSLDMGTARHFATGKLLRFLVPAGSQVLPLMCISRYEEQEVLLPRGVAAVATQV